MTDPTPVEIHPCGLREGDRLLDAPDAPGRGVDWVITRRPRIAAGIPVVDYVTGDGTAGTYGFEQPAGPDLAVV